jgi:putative ABC transport system permease protein
VFFDPRKLRRRLHYWRNHGQLECELREELEEHRRLRGDASVVSPARHIEDARAVWISPRLDSVMQDIRYGARQLRQNLLFSLIGISGLALAIGLNTSAFSVLEAVYWRPLPVKDADRVVRIFRSNREGPPVVTYSDVELRHYRESAALEQITAFAIDDRLITEWPQSTAPRATVAFVAPDFFPMLGGQILLGRLLQTDEPETTALLSESAWHRRLSARADIVGTKFIVNGIAFTIAGVVADKSLAIAGSPVDLVMPLRSADLLQLPQRLQLLGKLPRGISIEQAEGALNVASQRWFAAHQEDNRSFRPLVLPARLATSVWSDVQGTVVFLAVTVLLVLFISCANLTNLLLARAEARQREMAVRLSLGASRLRLIRQLLTECFLLTTVAGVLGMACTNVILRAVLLSLPRMLPTELSVPWIEISMNGNVFLFTFSLCALTAFFFGLAPARAATRVDFARALPAGGRLSKLLIVAQMSACVVLLIAAASLNRTMSVYDDSMSALDAKPVVQVELRLARYGYTNASAQEFIERARQRLALLPEIDSTGFTPSRLLTGPASGAVSDLQVEGREALLPAPSLIGAVSNGMVRVFGLKLRNGRDFTVMESRHGASVVLINEPMARDIWPQSNPVGQRIRYWSKGQPGPWREIVGVVAEGTGEGPSRHSILEPLGQTAGSGFLQIRTRRGEQSVPLAVRQMISELDTRIAVSVSSAEAMVELGRMGPRLIAAGALLVGLISLFMGAIGLYGVTAYLASRRTKEIGLRMAMGARPHDVVWMMIRQGIVLVVAGLMIGSLVAGSGEYYLSGLARGTSSLQVLTYLGVAGFLVSVALTALVVPSFRAARVDPIAALRQDG